MSMGADRKANAWGGGALERGHGASLERLAELGDALSSVGAFEGVVVGQDVAKGRRYVPSFLDAAELVAG